MNDDKHKKRHKGLNLCVASLALCLAGGSLAGESLATQSLTTKNLAENTKSDATVVRSNNTSIVQTSTSSVDFYVNSNAWAKVHYSINGGQLYTDKMSHHAFENIQSLSDLPLAAVIRYWFTYQGNKGRVINTAGQTYTLTAPDADGDGIYDSLDLCANTPPNTPVDTDGCAILVTDNVFIQTEDYINYFDTSPGNNGGVYRQDDVDLEANNDDGSGYHVGWTEGGEWLEYNVTLTAGTYDISTRVASDVGGGHYTLKLDGQVIGTDTVGHTGGWQSFVTQDVSVSSIDKGVHTLRLEFTNGLFNINWINLIKTPEVEQDSDNDGVVDTADLCPNTPANTDVDASGCAVIIDRTGLEQNTNNSVDFYVNSPSWADVNYSVNGGSMNTERMSHAPGKNTEQVNNLSIGDTIEYWFSWAGDKGSVVSTNGYNYTLININDFDNDGVDDALDLCANTPADVEVNADGCPLLITDNVFVQAEDYSNYFDTTPGNIGGVYRNDDVDMEGNNDNGNGFHVGWTEGGEWLEYDVTLAAGTYDISTRVASAVGGGNYTLKLDGQIIGSSIVGNTGGWVNFMTQAVDTFTTTEGAHTLRIDFSNGLFNINWFNIVKNIPELDSDNDGVFDHSDLCPNTPTETPVDASGCALVDSDNDGLFDNLDVCPNSPAGTTTDSIGCAVVVVVDTDGDGVADDVDQCSSTPANGQVSWTGCSTVLGDVVNLYGVGTVLEQGLIVDRGDAIVTRFADRGRDRHAKEDHFQIYDHYLSHYWTHRTARFEFVDYVAKGGSTIEVNFVTEWKLQTREFRAWYSGLNTVAEYHGNYEPSVVEVGHGTYDDNLNQISTSGDQYKYTLTIAENRALNGSVNPLAIGQEMEVEVSQFLDGVPEGRSNYYGTTYLYMVGVGGMVPWYTVGDFADKSSERENAHKLDESAWLGGRTTLPYNYTGEPDNHFMQMATNLSSLNGQPFVLGRRIHHTDFESGQHDERVENGVFAEMAGKAGTHYVNTSCSGCHERNGRAAPVAIGEPLHKWVFKVGDANGNPDPQIGRVLQPGNVGINDAADGEGSVSIASWTEMGGLRSPNYAFSKGTPATFSARIAPQLVGLGLLEAIKESDILALEDADDSKNSDGISGKAQRTLDPVSGETRVGRFGYKATTTSVKHQVAGALNTDMGVMTTVLPQPDCGSTQTTCGNSGSELADEHLDNLVKYIALLGVRAQRGLDDEQVQQGKAVFTAIGCDGCHTQTFETSANHPFAELRSQTIHPYTDLLVHDMGAGLADSLGEGQATGAEWRTTPLWGLGLSACVTGGVTNPTGAQGDEVCTANPSYLHDGRARTIDEAIRWHGGEGENARAGYTGLSGNDKTALLRFLQSL